MTLATRALALVLAALVALTGASLDLCACTPGDHGPLCAPPWTPPRRRHLELHVLRL